MKEKITTTMDIYHCDLCGGRLTLSSDVSIKAPGWLMVVVGDGDVKHVCPACRETLRETDQTQIGVQL